MRILRGRSWAGFVIAGVVAGCGPEGAGGGSGELEAFEAEVDQLLEAESKADTPSTTPLIVGDITPGSVVSHDVSPSRRLVGWTFRAEDTATVNAATALRPLPPVSAPPVAPAPPAGGATTNTVLYRRTSCLGRWERVPGATGSAVLATRLPSAGEYLLVSGARDPNATATLSASFAADQAGKVVSNTDRHLKLVGSWLPGDSINRLEAAGVKSFAEVRRQGIAAVSRKTGLSTQALTELSTLATWLDSDGVSYEMACSLQRGGVRDPEAYYRLSTAAQQRFAPAVPAGSVPYNPCARDPSRCGTNACVQLEAPRASPDSNGPPVGVPYVSWLWYPTPASNQQPWIIPSRPWKTSSESLDNDPRWYPDPGQGWDLLGYNFGRNDNVDKNRSATLGYMLFVNRHIGLMRLFIYIPNSATPPQYDELAGRIAIVRQSDLEEVGWIAPTEPLPPTNPRAHGRGATFSWRAGGERGFNTLQPGSWARTEFSTFYPEDVYSPSSGRAEPKLVQLALKGIGHSEAHLYADLRAKMSGTAVPSQQAGNAQIESMKNIGTQLWGLSDGRGLDTLTRAWSASWAAPLGMYFGTTFPGLFGGGGPSGPNYEIQLAGVINGKISGHIHSLGTGLGVFSLALAGTYDSTSSIQGWQGGIRGYQPCLNARWGTIRFNRPDPTPARTSLGGGVPVTLDSCSTPALTDWISVATPHCGEGLVGNAARTPTLDVGWLISRMGTTQITDYQVTLEVVYDEAVAEGLFADIYAPTLALLKQGAPAVLGRPIGGPTGFSSVGATRVTRTSWEAHQGPITNELPPGPVGGRARVYMRFWATLVPPAPLRPVKWQYAIDVTDKLVWNSCGVLPGTGRCVDTTMGPGRMPL